MRRVDDDALRSEEIDAARSRLHPVMRSFVSGSIAGCTQAVLMHPLDTVKVLAQSSSGAECSTGRQCARHLWRSGGIAAFYRGVQVPLAISGVSFAWMFATNEAMRRFVASVVGPESSHSSLNNWQLTAASFLTAPLVALLVTPFDLAKVMLQVSSSSSSSGRRPRGLVECIVEAHRVKGLRHGSYCGFVPITLTRAIGFTPYFIVEQRVRQRLMKSLQTTTGDTSKTATPGWIAMVSGSCGGVCYWVAAYPLDRIKTAWQVHHLVAFSSLAGPSAPSSSHSCRGGSESLLGFSQSMLVRDGARTLFRGLGPCLLRAAPANAILWFCLHRSNDWLDGSSRA